MNQQPVFIENIYRFIEQHKLLPSNSSIIIGLSGGPDSVFLLSLLQSLQTKKNLTLIAAHLNHEWRETAADDVKFCHDLCNNLDIKFVYTTASELPESLKQHGSKEEIGRRMRRYFLQNVRENNNADFIALGHHLQDQEETFFIRLIRGTTLSGLVGMKPKDGIYIRPLLETNKSDIVHYLNENNINYLTDPSNISESFLRNRIRLKVLPALQECDERFDANFLRTLHNLHQAEAFISYETEKHFHEIAELKNNTWYIDVKKFRICRPFMQNRLLMHWLIAEQVPFTPSQGFLEEIKRFLLQQAGKTHQIHEKWVIDKKQQLAHIKKI